jgi:hypothetical protein
MFRMIKASIKFASLYAFIFLGGNAIAAYFGAPGLGTGATIGLLVSFKFGIPIIENAYEKLKEDKMNEIFNKRKGRKPPESELNSREGFELSRGGKSERSDETASMSKEISDKAHRNEMAAGSNGQSMSVFNKLLKEAQQSRVDDPARREKLNTGRSEIQISRKCKSLGL